MSTLDGARFGDQSWDTQEAFRAVYGDNAESAWESEHNSDLQRQGYGQSGGSSGGDSGGGSSSGGNSYVSPTAVDAALRAASDAAQQAYLRAHLALERDQFKFMSRMEKDKLAFEKAREAFNEKIQEANVTGMYEGSPTWQRIVQEAGLTGYYNDNPTLARQQFETNTALQAAGLGAQLTGPANVFKYLRLMNGIPGGIRDMISAAAGKYILPGSGGGDPNARPERMTLQSLFDDISRGGYAPQSYSGVGDYSPSGASAPVDWYNYQPNGQGGYVLYPPGQPAPADKPQYSSQAPLDMNDAQASANRAAGLTPNAPATASPGLTVNLNTGGQAPSLPNPNQWNAENINRMNRDTRDVLLGLYEDQGWTKEGAWDAFKQSLPRYGGPQQSRVVMAG